MEEKTRNYDLQYWEKRFKEKASKMNLQDPTPVIREILKMDYFSDPGKIAIIGCAVCHEIIQFAKTNYLVTVISPAMSVIEQTRKKARKQSVSIETVYADLFNLPGKLLHKFDYLIEYSFCTEIQPENQIEYFDNIQKLIKPGGYLIVFLHEGLDSVSTPPFPVDRVKLENHLKTNFQFIESKNYPSSIQGSDANDVLMIWRKFVV